MIYVRWPQSSGGTSIPEYANFASLPATAPNGQLAITLSSPASLYEFDSTEGQWNLVGPGSGSGVSMVGTFDSQAPALNGATINDPYLYLQSATASVPGLVNISTQTFAGNKTFTGSISASNLTGTNSGDVSLSPVGSSPNANAASLSGQALTLQPFSATFPGVVPASGGGSSNYLRADGTWANPPGAGGANTSLSNLSAVAINASLLPGSSNAIDLGASNLLYNNLYVGSGGFGVQLYNGISQMGNLYSNSTTPSGVTGVPALSAHGLNSVGLFTSSDATANASATGNVLIESGNKTAGTGNSGNVAFTIGTSSGGTQGVFKFLKSGVASVSGQVWTASATDGTGYWANAGSSGITALTGDGTATGPGSAALTLATVNSNVGSFTNANITVNAKGLITAASSGANSGFSYLSSNTSVYGGTNSTLSFTGADNTVVGVSAGNALAAGTDNTLYGYEAGENITSGSFNTIIGSLAGIAAGSTAIANSTLIGYKAGTALTGNNNTFVGYEAGQAATSVSLAVCIGTTAVASTESVVIGSGATPSGGIKSVIIGWTAAGGAYNYDVVIGAAASVYSGSQGNIVIGYNASAGDGSGLGNIAIGYGAYAQGAGSIAIGYQASDNSSNYSIIMGQAKPNNNSVCCFGTTTTQAAVLVTTALHQITFGTSGSAAVPLTDMFLGRGAVGDATAPNCSLQPSPVVGSNIAGGNLTIAAGNGTGTGGSGSINFQTAQVAGSSSTANTLTTYVSISNKGAINSAAPQTTLTGSVGTAVCSQPFQGSSYKKVLVYLNGYTDTGSQTYTFPTAFTQTPYVYGSSSGVAGATVTTTSIQFTVTTISGFVFVEGY